ncbi:MAG: hypothetical protein V4665_02535 [Patescibacteria group bacterium]
MKKLKVLFLTLFIIGLFMVTPMLWYILTHKEWTFMAKIDMEMHKVTYHFLPITWQGREEVLEMYILYVCVPTALSALGYIICHHTITKRSRRIHY